jgi:cell wall-associated NlpC family hydrolase
VRLRTLSVALSSILTVAACATPAVAGATTSTEVAGGAAPSAPTTPTTPTAPATPAHHAPITAKTPNIAYNGPVYEKNAAGQVVPYTPAPSAPTPSEPGEATASSTSAGSTSVTVTGGAPTATPGGASTATKPELLVPGHTARIIDGFGAAPIDAPAAVQQIIWAGNQIVGLPYIYGGGHASFISPGYDCSGTVSYALHGANLLSTPMDSTEFETWQGSGVGTWVTIFANGGHAYMTVAGIRLDTSPANDPSGLEGPRWRPLRPENAGFVVRHPLGL